ncbi:hypothetical protein [Paenibacillus sp. NPDC058071]|uniref:CDI toxin immunity protein n=1 Tax=Paenibacillus sp. NPDC058071 TaxID=3346326 RepID=UPI0036DE6BD1
MEDRNARRFRMEQLKRNIIRDISYGELFNECIAVLDPSARVYSQERSQEIADKLTSEFPFTNWGRVDWDSLPNIIKLKDAFDLKRYTTDSNQNFYIIWDEYNLPVVETTLGDVINHFKEITAVGFDTWFVNFDESILIENHHEGEITVVRK